MIIIVIAIDGLTQVRAFLYTTKSTKIPVSRCQQAHMIQIMRYIFDNAIVCVYSQWCVYVCMSTVIVRIYIVPCTKHTVEGQWQCGHNPLHGSNITEHPLKLTLMQVLWHMFVNSCIGTLTQLLA